MPLWTPVLLRFADRLFNLFLREPDLFDSRFEYLQRALSSMFSFPKEGVQDVLSASVTLLILLFSTYCTFRLFKGLLTMIVKYFFLTLFMALVIFYVDWDKVNRSLEWMSTIHWQYLVQPQEWVPALLKELKATDPIEFLKQTFGL